MVLQVRCTLCARCNVMSMHLCHAMVSLGFCTYMYTQECTIEVTVINRRIGEQVSLYKLMYMLRVAGCIGASWHGHCAFVYKVDSQ